MRNLWKTMGGYDALVQYNECAVRQFIRKWDVYRDEGMSHADFIKSQAEEVDINLGYIDFNHYRQDVYLWYLIHPYGCIDTFKDAFKDDLKVFGYDINLDFPDKNALEKLILGLQKAGISISIEDFKLDLDQYYRWSRNLLAHKLDDKEKKKLEHLYCKLDKEKIFSWYPSLTGALSAPCHYTFDDYTLCTANLKNIADILTTDVYNSINWNKFNVDELSKSKHLRRFIHNPDRFAQAVKGYIQSHYGVILPHDELNILINKIKDSYE
ncbi:MAG: hypothetical protein K2K25_01355 [Muribaculaceae bacterium]|nr:hypothetical protein [Muribaculaceae bacterium]